MLRVLKASLSLLCLVFALDAGAREVDNYLAWGVDMEDAGPQLDEYMRIQLRASLARLNSKQYQRGPAMKPATGKGRTRRFRKRSCVHTAHNLMQGAFYYPTYQKIEQYLEEEPGIDRYPRRPRSTKSLERIADGEIASSGYMNNREYRKASIVKTSPFNVPLSRIVNVYGIYSGTDKFGHFTSFGARYQKKYTELLESGMDKETAFNQVMDSSYQSENGLVGMYFTKVFSRGDLEANFQGMLFVWRLCQQDADVRLRRGDDGWELQNLQSFSMQDYINPDWDESFNSSLFSKGKWRKHVVPTFIARADCEKLASEWVRKQRTFYGSFAAESLSTSHGENWMPRNLADRQPDENSLQVFCGQESAD